jgi:DNA modification methylase
MVDLLPTPNCVITDPPYGVDFRSRRAETPEGKRWVADIANDKELDGAIALFHEVMFPICKAMPDNSDLYVFTRWDIVGEWITAVRALPGFQYKMMLVWDKGIPGMGDIDSNWGCGHELILYCKKGRRDIPYRRSSIIAVDKVHATQHIHPTEKPVGLLEKLIEMSTDPGDLIVDPFSGSGSTVVAAQRTGRSAIGIEENEGFVLASRIRITQDVMSFE